MTGTAIEVAAIIGVNERTIRRAIHSGRITAEKRGRGFVIDVDEARAALTFRVAVPPPVVADLTARVERLERHLAMLGEAS